jgi:hypothetical protein
VSKRVSNAEGRRLLAKTQRSRWSAAVPDIVDGIRFPSRLEARLYGQASSTVAKGERLYLRPRFPLLSAAPSERKTALYYSPDIVIVRTSGLWDVYEAKGRRSRDYELRRRAFEACYAAMLGRFCELTA